MALKMDLIVTAMLAFISFLTENNFFRYLQKIITLHVLLEKKKQTGRFTSKSINNMQ